MNQTLYNFTTSNIKLAHRIANIYHKHQINFNIHTQRHIFVLQTLISWHEVDATEELKLRWCWRWQAAVKPLSGGNDIVFPNSLIADSLITSDIFPSLSISINLKGKSFCRQQHTFSFFCVRKLKNFWFRWGFDSFCWVGWGLQGRIEKVLGDT